MNKRLRVLLVFGLLSATALQAPAQSAGCPAPADLTANDLYGLWRLVLWPADGRETDPVSTGAMLLERHPEYPDSVRGRLRRSGPGPDLEAQVAGDVTDDGEFNLDESADGRNIDAVWVGDPSDCGRTIRGERRSAEGRPDGAPALQFLLQRPLISR